MTNYSTSPNERITKVVKASKEERAHVLKEIRRRRATKLAQREKVQR